MSWVGLCKDTGETVEWADVRRMVHREDEEYVNMRWANSGKEKFVKAMIHSQGIWEKVFDKQKVRVLGYLFEHLRSSDNIFSGSAAKVARETGISHSTVMHSFGVFKSAGLIRKVAYSEWMINPDVILASSGWMADKIREQWNKLDPAGVGESEDKVPNGNGGD